MKAAKTTNTVIGTAGAMLVTALVTPALSTIDSGAHLGHLPAGNDPHCATEPH